MNEMAIATDWASLKEQAAMLVKSGFLPASVNSPEKAIAIAITSKELGIGMMEGFRSINVIQGKPTISPQLMLALANRTKQLEDISIDATDNRCIVIITRKDRKPHPEEFGVKEATALGLIDRDNYRKQRATMFKWRALAAALRVTFPDVMLGFYTPEEMGAEVRVTDTEEMEITDVNEGYPTGVRVPKKYWDLRDSDPEGAQALLGGADFFAKKVPDSDPKKAGWYIFSKEKVPADWMNQSQEAVISDPQAFIADQIAPKSTGNGLVTSEEQLEIVVQAKQRGITQVTLKKLLKENFGVEGWSKLTKEQYPKVMEMLIRYDSAEVGA